MATGRHRKHGIRLLARSGEGGKIVGEPRGRRIYDDLMGLLGVVVVGPEYEVGVLEAPQVLRRDAGSVTDGPEVVEIVVVQLFLQPEVDDMGTAANCAWAAS